MATRDELLGALIGRYGEARRAEKGRILTEFAEVTGYHRKHAERLLRGACRPDRSRPRPERRVYDEAVREALIVLWEASDRVCGKRLKPLIPMLIAAMERHGHLALDAEVRARLGAISAATIDRVLAPARAKTSSRRRRVASSPAIRRSVPIRTYADWDDPAPGFMEADLVAHSGPMTSGSFVQTLVLTDIASGWTECAPLLFREQQLLGEVMTVVREAMPFPLLGFDTDNDTVFINETIKAWCEAAGVVFTRSRPYRKNDQAHIEQKNGAVVRRMVGYRRLEGLAAARALARLYRPMRLFVFFQPSFKLAEKRREGALVRKRYHPPLTPHQRLVADPRVPQALKDALDAQHAELDPVRLLGEIRAAQQALVEIADRAPAADAPAADAEPTLEAFLAGLRLAWREGEVRPTARPKTSKPRYRTVPDPLEAVIMEMKAWFDADPGITGRQLLDRLQAADPETYPDTLIRTVQRRLKVWRREHARTLVIGPSRHRRGGCRSLKLGNIPNEASAVRSGTFLSEAIRRPRRLTLYTRAAQQGDQAPRRRRRHLPLRGVDHTARWRRAAGGQRRLAAPAQIYAGRGHGRTRHPPARGGLHTSDHTRSRLIRWPGTTPEITPH